MNKKETAMGVAETIRARRISLNIKIGYQYLLLRILALGAAGYFIFTQVFLIVRNTGVGMFPTLKDGDLVVAYRLQENYAKDDIVVYVAEGSQKIGRVAARETDWVQIDEQGTFKVNGTLQTGEILYPTYAKDKGEFSCQIPENEIFILGDYRTNTKDSRDYGTIPLSEVKGKVITVLRRREL